jgi:hypothetical protein
MKTSYLISLTASMVLLLHTSTYAVATESVRCQGGIVSLGDTAGAVMSKCGQPAYTAQRERKDVEADSKGFGNKSISIVTIDDWTFNFGPNEFQYRLVLENGKVTGIESLDYGY